MLKRRASGLLLLWLTLGAAASPAATYSEEAVKAAFLHRFGAYVQWPSPPAGDTPFVIAVVGSDAVVEQLERLLPGLSVQNRPAQVRRVKEPRELDGVHILYIGEGGVGRARPLMAAAAARPILVVTDDEDGLDRGGIINFVRVERSIRFDVSLPAADRSGLKIDSGLLSVAAHVQERPRAHQGCGKTVMLGAGLWRCLDRMMAARVGMTP